jgi:hypothetical protein
MAIEIYDLGSTISILNDGEYTIITKQDASVTLNGSIVALIDFSGQRYEYNFADVSVPSEASGADLAATLNEYLQSSGGGGGGGVESVTGNVVGGTSTNPTVNIGGNANEILYKNAFGVITSDPDFVRDKAGEWFWQYGRKGSGATEAITAIQANASVLAPSVVLEASANGGADSSGLQLNKTAPLISGKKANVAYQYNLPTTTPTANQILKANSATPTQLEWADGEINVKISLSAAQIKTANSVPINVGLPASGVGYYYRVTAFDVKVTFVSVQFTSTLLNIGVSSTNAAQREFNQLAVAYSLFKPSTEGINLISSLAENSTISVWADADSLVGDSTIDCYISVQKVKL